MKRPEEVHGIEVDQWVLCCPYCMDTLEEENNFCCGEAGHGEYFPLDDAGELIDEEYAERNYKGKSEREIYEEENPR